MTHSDVFFDSENLTPRGASVIVHSGLLGLIGMVFFEQFFRGRLLFLRVFGP